MYSGVSMHEHVTGTCVPVAVTVLSHACTDVVSEIVIDPTPTHFLLVVRDGLWLNRWHCMKKVLVWHVSCSRT